MKLFVVILVGALFSVSGHANCPKLANSTIESNMLRDASSDFSSCSKDELEYMAKDLMSNIEQHKTLYVNSIHVLVASSSSSELPSINQVTNIKEINMTKARAISNAIIFSNRQAVLALIKSELASRK